MKAVVQRVLDASCTVDGTVTGSISKGLLIYLGIDRGDEETAIAPFMEKIAKLRCFEDDNGRMNLSIRDAGGDALIISQFTLSADVYHGNRPSFDKAEDPGKAQAMYRKAVDAFRSLGIRTETGVFGAHMEISYINDGPVTFVYDSACFPKGKLTGQAGQGV